MVIKIKTGLKKPLPGKRQPGQLIAGCGSLRLYQYQKLKVCPCGKKFRMIHGLQKWCPECRIERDKRYAAKHENMLAEFNKKANGDKDDA